MLLFGRYLSNHIKSIIIFGLFSGIFGVVFFLFRLPVQAVEYAALLCTFLGLIILLVDFFSFRRKHQLLIHLTQEITLSLQGLPRPHGVLEQDYQQLIRVLYQDKLRLMQESDKQYHDLLDYYTLWVHQIKTPIAAMRLLLQSETTSQSQELLEELQRIEQYVEMVLCYLRLEGDSSDYVIRSCALDSIVKRTIRKYASQFIRKKITMDYHPCTASVLTDEKWLSFVLEQVLSNALKYTKPGGTITIELQPPKRLCIRDTGIGIAQEDLPRIFEQGFTGYNGRGDMQSKSSGIGLALCRRICQNLGHSISVQSEVGEGTCIQISLDTTKRVWE